MANRNQNFDFPPAEDSSGYIGSLTDRFQGLRQALNPDPGESSNGQQPQRPHRRPLPTPSHTNSTRFRPGRRSTQPSTHNDLHVLRASRSPSSSPAAYTPPASRPPRNRRSRNIWQRFRREMQDGTETLEDLIRERQARNFHLLSQLNGVCYRIGNLDHH